MAFSSAYSLFLPIALLISGRSRAGKSGECAGANDGMLHGFRADNGLEKIAYVPNLVYTNDSTNNLSLLTWQSYTHRYYVDGTPTIGDVFYGGAWHTMLVGGLRKGGRGYFALDITNPTVLTESNARNIARWEFTDPDLGYSFSQATIVKVADSTGTGSPQGKWVAIFGNGYNNTGTGHAVLFVVDIETGALIRKIDTAISGAAAVWPPRTAWPHLRSSTSTAITSAIMSMPAIC